MRKRLFPGILALALLGGLPALISHAGGYDHGDVAGAFARAVAGDARLDAAERQRVLDLVIVNIRQCYIDRKVAQKIADALLAHERIGGDRAMMGGGAFADLLTRQMRDASHNMDLMSPALKAQMPTSERKLEFDVASVRENKTGEPPYSNFPLGPGPIFGSKDGLLLAKNQTLLGYIIFAFKPDMLQSQQFQAQLPGWVQTTSYDIEARASGRPTKDDMRLMMQSLLQERFHLVIHRETREAPAYVLVLAKPGTLGRRIKPHSADDPDCAKTKFTKTTTGTDPTCGASSPIVPETPGDFAIAVYNMPMDAIAVELGRSAGLGRVASLTGRRVVNRTGLTGAYDYVLEFAPEQALSAQPDASADSEPGGPSFTAAVKSQLGLKLVPQKLSVEVIVVDRIERPSEN
jgi:uncharacterized protein (TIGR03435 family)